MGAEVEDRPKRRSGSRSRLPLVPRLYLWATERLYHQFAWAYDAVAWAVSLGQWSAWRRAALEYVSGPRVLELGFGTGALLAEMGRRQWDVVGLEMSPQMQRVAARRLRGAGLDLPRVRADAAALPFRSRTFDTVVSTFPSGYILDPTVLAEVARVLRRPALDQAAPRLVIAGLVLETDQPLLARLPWLARAGQGERALELFRKRAAGTGLAPSLHRPRARLVRAPILVLEKQFEP